ncbi:MAG: hypothetical protein EU533_01615, partial [Promethearchaeota archaeon]
MVIKKRFFAYYIFILLIIFIASNFSHKVRANEQESLQISEENCILDKVFTFEIGGPILNFSGIELQEHYVYYTRIQLVTPYWCNATVRIYDPDDKLFMIFNGTLFQEPSTKSWVEIPFGVAISGNHSFSFEI